MNRPLIVALAGAVVVVVALILTYTVGVEEDDVPPPPPPIAAVDAPPPAAAPAPQGGTEPAAPSPAGTTEPAFDVVRIDREGNAVMAGRAAPGSEVVITDGETELGRVTADSRGEWVFLPAERLLPGTRELALRTLREDGESVPAEGTVVLTVPMPDAAGDIPPLAVQTTPGEPSRVLQAPAPVLAEVRRDSAPGEDAEGGPTVIDVVDYDADGNLSFGGRATPGAVVQGYVDNRFIGRTVADEDGRWSLVPDQPVTPGEHALRADALSPEGDVVARAEIPFLRPESVQLPPGERALVVQPGNSLWRIARRTLGSGADFTLIYEANRSQIRNPDLIYPGQVIIVPERGAPNEG